MEKLTIKLHIDDQVYTAERNLTDCSEQEIEERIDTLLGSVRNQINLERYMNRG